MDRFHHAQPTKMMKQDWTSVLAIFGILRLVGMVHILMRGFFIQVRHPIRIRVSLAFIVSMNQRSDWLTAEGSSTMSEALSRPLFSQVVEV